MEADSAPPPTYDDPFSNYQGTGDSASFSRYEISAAWPSIRASFADDGDLMFSAAMAGTVLETGDIHENPFPIALTYVGETENNNSWNYQSIQEHPEFVTRLQTILEDRLQTKITLSVKTRAYTEAERKIQENAKKSPYQLDKDKEAILKKLEEMFNAELVYSVVIKRDRDKESYTETDENNDN